MDGVAGLTHHFSLYDKYVGNVLLSYYLDGAENIFKENGIDPLSFAPASTMLRAL